MHLYCMVSEAGEFFFGKFKHDFNSQIRGHGIKSDNQFYPYILLPDSESLEMWKTLFHKHGSNIDSCLLGSLLSAYKEKIKLVYINELIGGENGGLLERIQKNRLDNRYVIPWEAILLYI